ncbi:protein of unknown function [Azospirillum baldaniorum]|uniref:Uncharacterized protein n=1 Tax=Azospirillum baldaniorum TaxID=1064539 RepID=A0A9P1JRG0_9PROT|nr:protein of unknown function [Azospirillum baldaniorum]
MLAKFAEHLSELLHPFHARTVLRAMRVDHQPSTL